MLSYVKAAKCASWGTGKLLWLLLLGILGARDRGALFVGVEV